MTRVGFNVVLESAFLKIGRHLVELIHIPSEQAPTHFQLHGHVHDKRPRKIISNQLNLCVEVWDYKPVAEKTILSLLDKASKNEISFKVSNVQQNSYMVLRFLSEDIRSHLDDVLDSILRALTRQSAQLRNYVHPQNNFLQNSTLMSTPLKLASKF